MSRQSNEKSLPTYNDDSHEQYAAPPGPPPGFQQVNPPHGPPLSHASFGGAGEQLYAPPSGPPPGHGGFAPPPGPPPGYKEDPPVNNAWMSIPDTSLLPPPPSIGHEVGSTSNAEPDEADRAHEWCRTHPLIEPHQPAQVHLDAVRNGDVRIVKSPEYKGDLIMPEIGLWRGSTRSGAKDACLISSAPLYFASTDSPSGTGQKKTIYYEIEIKSLGRGRRDEECTIAIGYCAIPYPTWRMPGWERGSLGVHSDDGRRYVNDTWGGKDFTAPMKTGETVGLGVTFSMPADPPGYNKSLTESKTSLQAEVFFTRNGQKDGSWSLHEELDEETDQGIDGLDGTFDLFAAIGIYGGADFDIRFKRDRWLWRPR